MSDPSSVITLKILKFIRTIPAGIEIKCRTPGRSRAKKIPPASYRVSQCSASSNFFGGNRMNRPNFTTNGRPNQSESQYITAAPKYAPNVLAKITPVRLNRPWAARNAAGGTTTSAGNGIGVLPIAIKATIPR